jgi:hypothetical protein
VASIVVIGRQGEVTAQRAGRRRIAEGIATTGLKG